MADFALPTTLVRTEFTIAPWAPGQADVVAPYRPALEPAGPLAVGWRGTIGLRPSDPSTVRDMLSFQARLRGNRHRVRINLPDQYKSRPPPPAARARTFMNSATLDGDTLVVSYRSVRWDDVEPWTPDEGSYCTLGDRLYMMDELDTTASTMRMIPAVLPLATVRGPGIQPTPGGGAPTTGIAPPNNTGEGITVFRGSLYESYFGQNNSQVFWTDPYTGTRRRVLTMNGILVDALATVGGNLYAAGRRSGDNNRYVYRLHLDLADPNRNSFDTILTLTAVPNNQFIRGLSEWSVPGSRDVHIYCAVGNNASIFRSTQPFPDRATTSTFASRFTAVTGTTGFSNVSGLSPGPHRDDPLYILDRGLNRIYTWDGNTQETFAVAFVGAPGRANDIALAGCQGIEWFQGQMLVQNFVQGTTPGGLARVNYDVFGADTRIRFGDAFLWARLATGPSVGPVGSAFPTTTFDWVEVPKQP